MRQKSGTRHTASENVVKDIRCATRKQYSAEEKMRIVLEGLRGEDSIAELCRREGINQNLYYRWSKDFNWRQLVVTDQRQCRQIAGLRSVAYPSQPKNAAVDTDLLDVAVIQFSDDVDAAFFKDAAYILEDMTIATSKVGDTLHVAGALKAMSEITEHAIAPIYCLLEMVDETRNRSVRHKRS